MSRNSRALELQRKISELDALYDSGNNFDWLRRRAFGSVRRLYRPPSRSAYLAEIYRTGQVPRKAMQSLVVREEVPNPHLCEPEHLGTVLATTVESPVVHEGVPNPHLYDPPRPKRGRPRKDAPHWYEHDLQCTKRHARRLVVSGKPRARNRKPHDAQVVEALQARKRRAALARELRKEDIIEHIAWMLDVLRRGKTTALRDPSPAYDFARKWVEREGVETSVLVIYIAMKDETFCDAAELLGISRASLYRRHGKRLDELRRRGETLAETLQNTPTLDLERLANRRPPKRQQVAVDRVESVWEEQTTFRQKNERGA